jgi:hypothetical protein
MALNDEWTYTRTPDELRYTVYAVNLQTGEAKARCSFYLRTEAEARAAKSANCQEAGPGWEYAIENERGRVLWTSF